MIINKLFLDNNYTVNPNGSITKARNVVFDKNFAHLINEDGFTKIWEFSYDICGIISTNVELVVFCTNSAGIDEIRKVDDFNNTLILKGDLSFTTASPIKGEYQYNNLGQLIVCFNKTNDTNNTGVRILNLMDLPFEVNATTKIPTNLPDAINKLKLFPNYIVPNFLPYATNEGNIPKGTYHFILSYYLGDHDRLNWTYPSRPLYITQTRGLWQEFNSTTTISGPNNNTYVKVGFNDNFQYDTEDNSQKALAVNILNLDITFAKYKLAVIYRTNTSVKVYDLGDHKIDVTTHVFTSLPLTELSLDEVTIPNIDYGNCEDLTISADRLTLGGTSNDGYINYQKYANNIKVVYSVDTNHDEPDAIYFNMPYKTGVYDEIYALYIGVIGKSGTNKGFFHIPGRAPKSVTGGYENRLLTEGEKLSYNQTNSPSGNLSNREPITLKYYYQLYNTAANYTISENSRTLGYWQNQDEYYPNISDFEIWDVDVNGDGFKIGDLGGLNVRHHRMPDIAQLYTGVSGVNKLIKLKLTNVKFPKDILDDIQGFTLAYANRNTSNSTVLAYYPLIRNKFWLPYSLNSTGEEDGSFPVRFNDFSLLTNKPTLISSYLKGQYVTIPIRQGTPAPTSVGAYVTSTSAILSYSREFRMIGDYMYNPRDNAATTPSNKGREEALILSLNNYYNDTNGLLVCSLKANLNNVYTPFFEQRLSITNKIVYVEDNIYVYSTPFISDFDGYLTGSSSIMYRGDQTIEIDETESPAVLTRHDGDGDIGNNNNDPNVNTVINVFKYANLSTINTDAKSLSKTIVDFNYKDDRTFVENALDKWYVQFSLGLVGLIAGKIWGKPDSSYSYDANFVIDPQVDPGISYSREYSFTNSIVPYYSYNYNNVFVNNHPYRIARSAVQSKEALTLNWRYFSALEYYEMPKHRGAIKGVTGQDNLLLIHMEHSLYVARFKDKISIPEGEAYIGVADIFDRPPEELRPVKRGTAGLQSRFSNCISEYGYTFVDMYDGCIYNYSNNSFDAITDLTARELFKTYMTKYSSDINSLTGKNIIIGDDFENKRLIIANLGTNDFTVSFSYNPATLGWVSFHDYNPAIIVNNRNGCYSANHNNLKQLYKFNTGAKGTYYNGTKYESYIDVLINDNPRLDKVLNSVSISSGVNDEANHIDKLFVYNKNQCSKVYTLTEFVALSDYDKLRYLGGLWNYDLIRDYTNDSITQNLIDAFGNINNTAINIDKDWYNLSNIFGKFFVIRLITSNNAPMVFRDLEYDVSINRR